MDPFNYFPRENPRVVERERRDESRVDGWSPNRRELRELLGRLRDRYGRRHVFRFADVERELLAIDDRTPPRALWRETARTAPRGQPRTVARVTVDLTCDEVLE